MNKDESAPPESLDAATEHIREVYAARKPKSSPGEAMWLSRLDTYERMLSQLDLLPFGDREILDVGCANGKWLGVCCDRWHAKQQHCHGADLRDTLIKRWQAENPDSRISLQCCPADRLDYPDHRFDIIHQSMMFSSVPDASLRTRIAQNLWRMLRPEGFILSYDFWINPLNRDTVGIRPRDLQQLFPGSIIRFSKTITLAAPLCRMINRLGAWPMLALEKLYALNTHCLVALEKPT